jgi:hypothetical protein
MKQLSIFSVSNEVSSLIISEQKQIQNQSKLSAHITASYKYLEDEINIFNSKDDDENWGDIYDEYEDFNVCSKSWCK